MSNYTHILVAVDFSTSSEQVVNKARDIAQSNNARLSLLHIVEYIHPIDSIYEPVLANTWVIDENALLTQAKESLKNFCTKQNLSTAQQHVVLGTPKYEISQFVKDQQCDLVVMGSHGRHGINILLGSTTNAVLHKMPCDILAVKISS